MCVEHMRCIKHVHIVKLMTTRPCKVRSGKHTAETAFDMMETFHLVACFRAWPPPLGR